jgi:hypothetical protein
MTFEQYANSLTINCKMYREKNLCLFIYFPFIFISFFIITSVSCSSDLCLCPQFFLAMLKYFSRPILCLLNCCSTVHFDDYEIFLSNECTIY